MSIDRSAFPFVAGALVPAVVLAAAGRPLWAWPFVALAAFLLYFFRDPERPLPSAAAHEDAVIAPADGRVMVAGAPEPDAAPPGAWQQISIFLSPMDVHINRAPIGGRILKVMYRPGRFLPAYRAGAAAENERNEIEIDHGGRTILCRQVVGVLARRIVCRVREGDQVRAGQRIGLMKFGSRMDLLLPEPVELHVRVGDRVRGGETVLATLTRTRGHHETAP